VVAREQFDFVGRQKGARLNVSNSRYARIFSLAAALLLSSCAPTLSGQLIGPGGEVVSSPDARVNIQSLSTPAEGSAPTHMTTVDGSGRFKSTAGLASGPWLVEALVPGYAVASKRIELPMSDELKLTLTPVGKTKASPVRVHEDVPVGRGAGGASLTPPQL